MEASIRALAVDIKHYLNEALTIFVVYADGKMTDRTITMQITCAAARMVGLV